jgi:hypothetical protein
MKRLTLANKKLIAALQKTTDFVFQPERRKIIEDYIKLREDSNIPQYAGWEEEYLAEALKKPVKDYGFPLSLNGIELVQLPNQKIFDQIWAHIKEIQEVLGVGYHALSAYYPSKGYIGWHHNGNAPGYNLLLTYNPDGNGWFKYYDLKTKQIVTMEDTPGWSAKVGYYGRQDTERDKLFWHSAYTESPRLTISFVMNHHDMWNDIIDDIQTP